MLATDPSSSMDIVQGQRQQLPPFPLSYSYFSLSNRYTVCLYSLIGRGKGSQKPNDSKKASYSSLSFFRATDPAAMAWVSLQADLQGAAGLHRHVYDHKPHLQARRQLGVLSRG
jgi:hypothetical protein